MEGTDLTPVLDALDGLAGRLDVMAFTMDQQLAAILTLIGSLLGCMVVFLFGGMWR